MPSTTSSRTDTLPLDLQHCQPVAGGATPPSAQAVQEWLRQLPHWRLSADGREISREFRFSDFCQTMAFVNAVAWIARHEDHHPQMALGYNHATVNYTTHSVDAITRNDFICAAKIDKLLAT